MSWVTFLRHRSISRRAAVDDATDGEETLAAVLRVALDRLVQGVGAVGDLLIGGDRGDCRTDIMQIGERLALGADEELGVRHHERCVRDVDSGCDRPIDAVVTRVADDADNLAPAGGLRGDRVERADGMQSCDAKLVPDGIELCKVAAREALVDHGDEIAARIFCGIPDAATAERNLEGGEVFRADEINARLLVLLRVAAGDFKSKFLGAAVRRGDIHANGQAADPGHSGNLLTNLLGVCSAGVA